MPQVLNFDPPVSSVFFCFNSWSNYILNVCINDSPHISINAIDKSMLSHIFSSLTKCSLFLSKYFYSFVQSQGVVSAWGIGYKKLENIQSSFIRKMVVEIWD